MNKFSKPPIISCYNLGYVEKNQYAQACILLGEINNEQVQQAPNNFML